MISRHFFLFCALLTILGSLFGCSGKDINENDVQALYHDAEEDIKDKRYLMALDKLKTVKNKFPYSNLATQAKLRIADIYFAEENFIESASSYETFRDLHPKYEKADYVIFQIGESYFNQLPGTIDRDVTAATKAIEAYRELKSLYPNSQHLSKSQEHLNECLEKLAGKEQYIADFYFKRKMYDSASERYAKIANQYPNTSIEQVAYWQWGQSLISQDKKDEARHVYRTYLSRYPHGTYSKKMSEWLEK